MPPSAVGTEPTTATAEPDTSFIPVKPPRNLHRLTAQSQSTSTPPESSTLGPAIAFKVPSLPRQRELSTSSSSSSTSSIHTGRRPLRMMEDGNGPTSPMDEEGELGVSTPNRLKRLSLISRRSTILDSPRSATATVTPITYVNRTPRSMRIRSSILYSPASASAPSRPTARSVLMSPGGSSDMQDGEPITRGILDRDVVKGETWSDRHADLLQSIAQKQRRINELKQELQAEQSALYSLKTHFASLVSTTFSSPPPSTGQTSTLPFHHHRSTSNTTEPDSVLLSPTASNQIDDREREHERDPPGFSGLLDEVLGNGPLVDPSVVEGGRRFIGNLMRTVGAAAGGTVPSESEETDHGNDEIPAKEGGTIGGVDLSSFKSMFSSWSSTSATPRHNTVRIRPADSHATGPSLTLGPSHEP